MQSSTLDPQQEWVVKFLSASTNPFVEPSQLRVLWFRNPTNRNSLRLTHQCFTWVSKHTQIPSWTVKVDKAINGKQFVQLERVFTSPYFLSKMGLTVFSEEDYIMLQLHAGNLAQYLDNLQI